MKLIFKLITAVLLAAALTLGGLMTDYNTYEKSEDRIECEDTGLVFSLVCFNGENESAFFVPCLGHAWVAIDNRTDKSVYIKDYELKPDEMLTMSAWGLDTHFGVAFNVEPACMRLNGRYEGRISLSVNIKEEDLEIIEEFIESDDYWAPAHNCTTWSLKLWNLLVDEKFRMKTQITTYTPHRLEKSMLRFEGVQTNIDMSRCGNAFYYPDGIRTELELCQ